MGMTAKSLAEGARRVAAGAKEAEGELNKLDGELGDGDLGITVSHGWEASAADLEEAPEDVGLCFLAASKAFQRVSSSSYGTLTATALMAVAKATKGRTDVPWSEVADLLAAARDAMMARGKGALGDKSVLDTVDATAAALQGLDDPTALRAAAEKAVGEAMDAFRDKPNKLGRARMFGDKTIGKDDPGMVAFLRIVQSLGS